MTPWEGGRPSAAPVAAPGVLEALQAALAKPPAAVPDRREYDHNWKPAPQELQDWEKMDVSPPIRDKRETVPQNWLNAARYSEKGIFPWEKPDASIFPVDPNSDWLTRQIRAAGTGLANVPFTLNAAFNYPNRKDEPAATPPTPSPVGGLPSVAIPRAPGSPFGGGGGAGGNPFATGPGGRGMEIPLPGGPTAPGDRSPGFNRYLKLFEGTGQNPRSSAFGPGQFINSTFDSFLRDRHPEELLSVRQGGDAARKALKLRYGEEAIDWYRGVNSEELGRVNLPVNDTTLALSHHLGAGGATKILRADPNAPMNTLFSPEVIKANPLMSGKTAGQYIQEISKFTDTSVTPKPPQHGAPPEQVPGAPADYSLAREYMDKAKPKPLDQDRLDQMLATGVFSKAAAGAAAVDPTRPGSFALALGGAGAGAAGGANEGQRFSFEAQQKKEAEERAYYSGRSTQELGIAGQQQDYGKYASDVAHKNATNAYNVATNNLNEMYKWQVGERAATMPKISFYGGNISVQYLDPATNSIKIHQVPKSMMDQAADIEKMAGALSKLPTTHPQAQALTAYMISQMSRNDPTGFSAMALMRQQVIKHALATGGIGAFKIDPKELAVYKKQVEDQTKGLDNKPEERYAAQQEMLVGLISNRMSNNEAQWLPVLESLARSGNTYALLEYQRMTQGR